MEKSGNLPTDSRQTSLRRPVAPVLAKAGELQPIVDLIKTHKDNRVRLAAIHTLQNANAAQAAAVAREVVAVEGLPEVVRTSVLEFLYKLDNEPAMA